MKFYSYDYVLSQISQQNGIMIGFGIVLLAITGFFAFKAYRDKKGTKFGLDLGGHAFGDNLKIPDQSSL